MNSQVEKLEALLAKVQRNRRKPGEPSDDARDLINDMIGSSGAQPSDVFVAPDTEPPPAPIRFGGIEDAPTTAEHVSSLGLDDDFDWANSIDSEASPDEPIRISAAEPLDSFPAPMVKIVEPPPAFVRPPSSRPAERPPSSRPPSHRPPSNRPVAKEAWSRPPRPDPSHTAGEESTDEMPAAIVGTPPRLHDAVYRVVSRPQLPTFGALLDRTLALRAR